MYNIIHVDGDYLTFNAGIYVSEEQPVHFAFNNVNNTMARLLKTANVKDYRIFLGSADKSNFRYQVAKTKPYKDNRKEQNRPFYEQEIREYLLTTWKAELVSGMEVDDKLGIEQTETTLLCSNDKDLWQIPGWHYDPEKGLTRHFKDGSSYELKPYMKKAIFKIEDPGFVDLRKLKNGKSKLIGGGQLWFCAQMLLGDSTDNIPGIPKYGEVKTFKELQHTLTYKEGIRAVYKIYHRVLKDSLTTEQIDDRFKEIAQLLWIRREEKGKIFPWEWVNEQL